MHQGFIRFWILAGLLMLSACVTPPPQEDPGPPPATAAVSSPRSARPIPPPLPAPAAIPDESAAPAVVPDTGVNWLGGEVPREFEQGKASWYGLRFNGRRTASGERYDMHGLTAAHRTLPFGTLVRVRSLVNGREVDVRITDRGPFSRNRVIDLSRGAAEAIGMLGLGVKDVLLLVPESTPAAAAPPAPRPRVVRRAPPR